VILYVRGSFVPDSQAVISVLDRGFLYGDAVYETVRSAGGKILFWSDHEQRLHHSAHLLGIDIGPGSPDPLAILKELLGRNDLADARLRLVVTRGAGDRDQLTGFVPSWVVLCEPFTPPGEEFYAAGIRAVRVATVRNAVASLNPEIKSCNLLNNSLARREAIARDAQEGVMLNPQGFLAEGAFSNLFWVDAGGRLSTPALSVGILPGVTRQKVLLVARRAGLTVREVEARPEELDAAREIFLTSTSWEVLGVTTWNGSPVGDGREGARARSLRAALRRLYDEPGESR
jgi:branched-chain amino acid aminotransferase